MNRPDSRIQIRAQAKENPTSIQKNTNLFHRRYGTSKKSDNQNQAPQNRNPMHLHTWQVKSSCTAAKPLNSNQTPTQNMIKHLTKYDARPFYL